MACRRVCSAGYQAALLRSAGLLRAPRQHSCTSVTTECSQQLARCTNAGNVPHVRSYVWTEPLQPPQHPEHSAALSSQRLLDVDMQTCMCIFCNNLSMKLLLLIKEKPHSEQSERPAGSTSTDTAERGAQLAGLGLCLRSSTPQFFIKPPLPSALLPTRPSHPLSALPPLLSP